jgi:hypothetical protein
VMTWTVTGTDHTGAPFRLQWTDRYVSSDLGFAVSYGTSDFVWALADIGGVTIDSFDVNVSSTEKSVATYTVTGMQQRRAGAWRPVSRDNPAVARAGARIKLRVAIKKDTDGSVKELPFTLTVPKNSAGKKLSIGAVGGSRNHLYPHGSLSRLRREIAATVRHDAIKVSLGGESKVLAPQDAEIGGRLVVPLQIR